MANQTESNNKNYLIDPTFTKVKRSFVLSIEYEYDSRNSSFRYSTPGCWNKSLLKKIIDWWKKFLWNSYKNRRSIWSNYWNTRNNDYTTDKLLDYECFSKHYKLIAIDLSKQIELENSDLKQQINSIGRLDEDNETMFFFSEKSEVTTFKFSQNAVTLVWFSLVRGYI